MDKGKHGKLNSSLLMDPERIPYVQMGHRTGQNGGGRWNNFDRVLFWAVPLLIFLGISALLLVVTEQEKFIRYETLIHGDNKQSKQWNELIFTQLWGYSSCLQFKDKHSPQDVTCRFENDPSFWSIHGIWPTRQGTMGPSFCTKVKFNGTELDSIRPTLNEFWYEIDSSKQGDHFWSHEWVKHGSCAKEVEAFSTELKYFTAALDLRQKYDLMAILKDSGIMPTSSKGDSGYSVDQITDAIRKKLGPTAVPYVQCLGKKSTKTNEMDYYLLAVELCFSKDLQQFMDCSHHRNLATPFMLGDNALPCPQNVQVKYFDSSA